jgi:hypothetical protein
VGLSVGEEGLVGGEAERCRSSSSSAWYPWQLEGWSGTPGSRGGHGGGLRGWHHRRARSRKKRAAGTCLGGLLSSPRSPGTKMAANGGRNQRDGAVAWSFGLLQRARPRKREKKGRCLGGLWGWCEFDGEVRASFYRPERPGARVARGGGPAACVVQRQARRLWGLAGVRGHVLWCCHERAGMLDRAEEGQRGGGKGEGSGCFPPFFRVSWPGSGEGRWGVDSGVRGDVHGYCYES